MAADGGANALHHTSIKAEAIIGDMDSVSKETIKLYPMDKRYKIKCQDTTDFEKCLGLIKAPKLLGVGFLEGRLDHQLANLSALVKFPNQKCILIGLTDICFLCPEEFSISLPIKTAISIYPMGATSGSSKGLKYPIDNCNLDPSRKVGTSNEVISKVKLQFKERFVRFGKFRYKDYHIIDKFKEFIELLDIGNSNVIDVINEELDILVDQVQSKDELSEEEQRIQEIEEEEINEGI
mgnify:CR=1 FL=1